MKAIIKGNIVTEKGILSGKAIIFDENIIDILQEEEACKIRPDEIIDAKGGYISPGFIDIHTHGTEGHDIMDGDEAGIEFISKKYASSGVTSFLATTMTMDLHSIDKALCNIRRAMKKNCGANILGCHLEGPFISRKYPGAQDTAYIINPDNSIIGEYNDVIKMVTIAPETKNSEEFIKYCVKEGIRVSIGHSSASYEESVNAIKLGVRSITHTFNAMLPLHHREPGIIGAAMDNADVYCELIADNVHVHPVIQRILLKLKGVDRMILITDSMMAASMSDGYYELGGQTVCVKNGSARLKNGTLAGSTLTIDKALRNFRENTDISVYNAIKSVTANPAKLLGIDNIKGSLRKGMNADIVVFDDDFNVSHTFVNGCLCYEG